MAVAAEARSPISLSPSSGSVDEVRRAAFPFYCSAHCVGPHEPSSSFFELLTTFLSQNQPAERKASQTWFASCAPAPPHFPSTAPSSNICRPSQIVAFLSPLTFGNTVLRLHDSLILSIPVIHRSSLLGAAVLGTTAISDSSQVRMTAITPTTTTTTTTSLHKTVHAVSAAPSSNPGADSHPKRDCEGYVVPRLLSHCLSP